MSVTRLSSSQSTASSLLHSPWMMAGVYFLLCAILAIGVTWSYSRGGSDFRVFYHAWDLVWQGRYTDIYSDSPDRYLYAPGFAFLLSPVSLIPFEWALAIWNLLKLALIGALVLELARALRQSFLLDDRPSWIFAAMAFIAIARPLLIDFQYGQVNLFVFGLPLWAILRSLSQPARSLKDALIWAGVAILGMAKLFTLAFAVVPYFLSRGRDSSGLRPERRGVLIGLAVIVFVPLVSCPWGDFYPLLQKWFAALQSKGIPIQSHNQSFVGFLYRFFGGQETHVLFLGSEPQQYGWNWFSNSTIISMGRIWAGFTFGSLLYWFLQGRKQVDLKWCAFMLALVILPSHLIWKPYFIVLMPLFALGMAWSWTHRDRRMMVMIGILVALLNFSGFDFVGKTFAAWLEAASFWLFLHLAVMAYLGWKCSSESIRVRPDPMAEILRVLTGGKS